MKRRVSSEEVRPSEGCDNEYNDEGNGGCGKEVSKSVGPKKKRLRGIADEESEAHPSAPERVGHSRGAELMQRFAEESFGFRTGTASHQQLAPEEDQGNNAAGILTELKKYLSNASRVAEFLRCKPVEVATDAKAQSRVHASRSLPANLSHLLQLIKGLSAEATAPNRETPVEGVRLSLLAESISLLANISHLSGDVPWQLTTHASTSRTLASIAIELLEAGVERVPIAVKRSVLRLLGNFIPAPETKHPQASSLPSSTNSTATTFELSMLATPTPSTSKQQSATPAALVLTNTRLMDLVAAALADEKRDIAEQALRVVWKLARSGSARTLRLLISSNVGYYIGVRIARKEQNSSSKSEVGWVKLLRGDGEKLLCILWVLGHNSPRSLGSQLGRSDAECTSLLLALICTATDGDGTSSLTADKEGSHPYTRHERTLFSKWVALVVHLTQHSWELRTVFGRAAIERLAALTTAERDSRLCAAHCQFLCCFMVEAWSRSILKESGALTLLLDRFEAGAADSQLLEEASEERELLLRAKIASYLPSFRFDQLSLAHLCQRGSFVPACLRYINTYLSDLRREEEKADRDGNGGEMGCHCNCRHQSPKEEELGGAAEGEKEEEADEALWDEESHGYRNKITRNYTEAEWEEEQQQPSTSSSSIRHGVSAAWSPGYQYSPASEQLTHQLHSSWSPAMSPANNPSFQVAAGSMGASPTLLSPAASPLSSSLSQRSSDVEMSPIGARPWWKSWMEEGECVEEEEVEAGKMGGELLASSNQGCKEKMGAGIAVEEQQAKLTEASSKELSEEQRQHSMEKIATNCMDLLFSLSHQEENYVEFQHRRIFPDFVKTLLDFIAMAPTPRAILFERMARSLKRLARSNRNLEALFAMGFHFMLVEKLVWRDCLRHRPTSQNSWGRGEASRGCQYCAEREQLGREVFTEFASLIDSDYGWNLIALRLQQGHSKSGGGEGRGMVISSREKPLAEGRLWALTSALMLIRSAERRRRLFLTHAPVECLLSSLNDLLVKDSQKVAACPPADLECTSGSNNDEGDFASCWRILAALSSLLKGGAAMNEANASVAVVAADEGEERHGEGEAANEEVEVEGEAVVEVGNGNDLTGAEEEMMVEFYMQEVPSGGERLLITVPKSCLCAASDYFKSMFHSDFAEKQGGQRRVLFDPSNEECSAAEFRLFLLLLTKVNTAEEAEEEPGRNPTTATLNAECCATLLQLADKYLVCSRFHQALVERANLILDGAALHHFLPVVLRVPALSAALGALCGRVLLRQSTRAQMKGTLQCVAEARLIPEFIVLVSNLLATRTVGAAGESGGGAPESYAHGRNLHRRGDHLCRGWEI